MKVLLGVSNRHIHLCLNDYIELFKDEPINVKNKLVQTGQYSTDKKVTIKTNKSIIENVRLIGPLRDTTQVELSKTDCYKLGIEAPVRESGNLKDACLVEIIGSYKTIERKCAIIANRHIHINKEDRKKMGLENIDEVKIRSNTIKNTIFENVKIKELPNASFELHLDTDDANGAFLKTGDYVEIIKE